MVLSELAGNKMMTLSTIHIHTLSVAANSRPLDLLIAFLKHCGQPGQLFSSCPVFMLS